MEYRIVFHAKAEAELEQLYEDSRACVAGGCLEFCRGHPRSLPGLVDISTVRHRADGDHAGLRIIGYRRAVSIVFAIDGERVLILGVFYAGRNITPELLEERL